MTLPVIIEISEVVRRAAVAPVMFAGKEQNGNVVRAVGKTEIRLRAMRVGKVFFERKSRALFIKRFVIQDERKNLSVKVQYGDGAVIKTGAGKLGCQVDQKVGSGNARRNILT